MDFDRRQYFHLSKGVIYGIAGAVFLIAFTLFGIIAETLYSPEPVRYDYNNADYKPLGNGLAKIWLRRTAVAKRETTLYVSRMLVNTRSDEQIILPPSEEIVQEGSNNVNRVFYTPELDPGEWCFVITTRWKPALSMAYHHIEHPKTCFTVPEKPDVTK